MSLDFHRSPEAMARCLVGYIRCDKRVRDEVYVAFGVSPHVETIREIRRAKTAHANRLRRQSDSRVERAEDGNDFRVAGLIKPTKRPPPESNALPAWSAVKQDENRVLVTMPEIIAAVADEFGFSMGEILATDRHREITLARRTIIYVLRERGNSFPRIGKRIERDHSSVLYNYRKFQTSASPEMRRIAAKYLGA